MSRKKTRAQCRQTIDGEICRLQKKRRLVDRAEGRHFAVRQLAPLKSTIAKHDCVCFRSEYGRRGGENNAVCHDGNFRKLADAVSRTYADGGQVTSFHFTDDLKGTSCGYWARRRNKGLRGGRRRRR